MMSTEAGVLFRTTKYISSRHIAAWQVRFRRDRIGRIFSALPLFVKQPRTNGLILLET